MCAMKTLKTTKKELRQGRDLLWTLIGDKQRELMAIMSKGKNRDEWGTGMDFIELRFALKKPKH